MGDKPKHAGGRPLIFETVEDLDAKIEEYFNGGYRKHVVCDGKDGAPIEVPAITLTDLCLFLGFADKCSFYDYEKRPQFSHSIKRARMTIEREYEERLSGRSAAGAIFALKNFGWRDKQEIDVKSSDGSMSPTEEARLEARKQIEQDLE